MEKGLVHFVLALCLLVLLVFLQIVGVGSAVLDAGRVATSAANRPAVAAFVAVGDFFAFLGRLRGLERENAALSAQVAALGAELARRENTAYENRILREALRLPKEEAFEAVPAAVIGYDPFRAEQKATLSGGRRDGIAEGDAVISTGGAMVGVIAAVFDQTSQMDLITSSAVRVAARTTTGSATGLLRGEHGLGLLLDLIAQDQRIVSGERVITSGLGGRFPPNLLLGEVGEVRSAPGELFKQASVAPAANLQDLRFVFVIVR